ncbi:MAG TPA: GNAT family N-acetyltransferase [Pseudonocardia sp.]
MLRPRSLDHPDAVALATRLQAYYCAIYGGDDGTSVDVSEFAPPLGRFVVGYVDGIAVVCGGWRARDTADDPALLAGDAELKRLFVDPAERGRGHASAVLVDLERTAAEAGRRRMVLETGISQPEAIALYVSAGYTPIPPYGAYRDEIGSRHFAKSLLGEKAREGA